MNNSDWVKHVVTDAESIDIHHIDLQGAKDAGKYFFQVQCLESSFPLVILKGAKPGPVFCINANIHGDEINGIYVIHRFIRELDLEALAGTIVAIPSINLSGLANKTRFSNGLDLNRLMPGADNVALEHDATARNTAKFTRVFFEQIILKCDCLFDLHTATTDCLNTFYIRASQKEQAIINMTHALDANIVVDNDDEQGTLRVSAQNAGIPSITIEVGSPRIYQPKWVDKAFEGIKSFINKPNQKITKPANTHIISSTEWIYSEESGILKVNIDLEDKLHKGQQIAEIFDIYGSLQRKIIAPYDAVVVGIYSNGVCEPGSRIVNLGLIE